MATAKTTPAKKPAAKKPAPRKVDPEKLDPSGANAGREERADLIKEAQKISEAEAKADQERADKLAASSDEVPAHVVKRDDAGAKEQQEAAQENAVTPKIDAYDGPPVVAPQLEKSKAKIRIVRITDDSVDKNVKETLFHQASGLRVQGDGFNFPGEVIIDVRKEDGQDHQRFSTYIYDENLDLSIMGIGSPGTWLLHAEQQVTQVGEGRDDHLPLILETKPLKLEVK